MLEHWRKLESTLKADYAVFQVRADRAVSPETGREFTFHVVDSCDWINVIPVTDEGKIVFVKQYRHGTEEITLEIPGGMVDAGETPFASARREMIEETGYDAEQLIAIGDVDPNPAIQSNTCHSYLALHARAVQAQNLGHAEEIEVVLIDPADVPVLIRNGTIRHALVVAAFYFFERYLEAHPEAAYWQ